MRNFKRLIILWLIFIFIVAVFYLILFQFRDKTPSNYHYEPETTEVDTLTYKNEIDSVNLKILKNEVDTGRIHCFDVSDNGQIAIGFDDAKGQVIKVYDNNGRYIYGYSFDLSYEVYLLLWQNEVLTIFYNRSYTFHYLDPNSGTIDVRKYVGNRDVFGYIESNNYPYRLLNGNKYIDTGRKLTKVSSNEEEIVIYDAGLLSSIIKYSIRHLIIPLLAATFFVTFIEIVFKKSKYLNK
ncbi:MAG: hypothetical protein FD141_271 [Fusobacteria bacterium]|nr:MAG: hypothetical protein FD141_271 [Fusobacteriota bacterium]KAF0229065.1 MAG: hypothetical protein FD182_1321 [Fusobacteriota bacterium]